MVQSSRRSRWGPRSDALPRPIPWASAAAVVCIRIQVQGVLRFKNSSEKLELSRKRRKLWLEALGLQDDDAAVKIRVCSDHFLTGRPAPLNDSSSIDWVPSLHMKLPNAVPRKRRRGKATEKFKERSLKTIPVSSKANARGYGFRRSDSKRSINCKVLLDGNLRCTSFNGTNGSGLAIIQKHGKFTSDNVTVKETSINDTVLRVRVIREDLYGLRRKLRLIKQKRKQDSSFGRQMRTRASFSDDLDYDSVSDDYSSNIKTTRNSREEQNMYNTSNSSYRNSRDSNIYKATTPRSSMSKVKTLNRVIKRNDKNKIKVKFFPKTSTPSTRRSVKNGTIQEIGEKPLLHREILFLNQFKNPLIWTRENLEPTYYLKFAHNRGQSTSLLRYPFQKLVMDVKHMKLPGPSWKIKVIIRQGRISAITFTNKQPLERCVSFSADSDIYNIVIQNRPVLLLGCPKALCSAQDLEVLMDIVENIDPKNPMILYK